MLWNGGPVYLHCVLLQTNKNKNKLMGKQNV